MEGLAFDALVRRVRRRNLVQRGLAGAAVAAFSVVAGVPPHAAEAKKKKKITLCLNGQTISAPKKKKPALVKKGATVGACAAQPTTQAPAVCGGQVQCLGACCTQCCLPLTGEPPTVDDQCAAVNDVCCSAAAGGGFCGPDSKCCPITDQYPVGSCTDTHGECCDEAHGGGACPSGATCCLEGGCDEPDVSACCLIEDGGGSCPVEAPACCPENAGYACCEALGDCCITGVTDCGAGRICDGGLPGDGGCCIEASAGRSRASRPNRFGARSGKTPA